MSATIQGFFWYDYIIFIVMLAVCTSVGLYYGCFGTRQRTVSEYLLGNKNMAPIPIGVSVAVAHVSGATMLLIPTEVYRYGAFYFWTTITMILSPIISNYLFLSVFFKLQITSLYEYLEKRFDNKCRLLSSFFFLLFQMAYLPLAIYLPSLAFTAATGIDVILVVLVTLSICAFYTAIGGLKSVVWTDLFQLLVMILSFAIVSVIGVNSAGGFNAVWNKALEGGRLDILEFDLDPTKRDGFWLYVVGFTLIWTAMITLSQSGVQKFMALSNFRDIVWATTIVNFCFGLTVLFVLLLGFLIYSRYSDCDPVVSKTIHKYEQLVPFYIMDVAGHIPGISGLFIVALFCAALSTVSSSLNALSGVIYKDFVTLFFKQLSEETASKILRLNVALCALVCLGVVFIMKRSSDIFPLIIALVSIPNGPTLGMFTLGVLFPRANAKGAFYGAIVSCTFLISMLLPVRIFYDGVTITYPTKPLSVEGCMSLNGTERLWSHSNNSTPMNTQIPSIFRISPFYHCGLGAVITIVVGLVLSYLTKKDSADLKKDLFSPVIHSLLPKASQGNQRELQHFITK